MNTIKIILAESGRTAELLKDFPLYRGQYNNKLLNILVPTSILAPQFDIQHYIGQMSGAVAPSTAELDAFVEANTYPERESSQGDIIEFYNTTSTNYYLYEFDGEEWGATEVNSFGTFTTLAGTSVKVGMIAVKRNGKIYESKSYFLRYLKTLTYQGKEYALYERKLPQEFTAIAGQGENAPTIVSNVVNVDTQTNEILSLITSQTCKLDVMMSTVLDQDEPVEASDLETLEAELNENSAKLELKQDKIDDRLSTTQKNVVGGINEVNSLANTNKSNIETNTQDIAQNKSDIAYLYSHIAQPEEYIGQMQGTSLPTNTELNEFVETTVDREPKNADVIIFILEVIGGTDKNYKYTYAADGWSGYEIPPMEEASNGTLGLIKGTYNVASANNTLIDIVGGEIVNIYIKDETNTYRNIREYLNTNADNIAKIIAGTTVVAKALSATNDKLGNDITQTYLTINAGVTKTQMKDYALPRVFNDVNFFTDEGYSNTVPTEVTPIHSLETTAVGDFEIFNAEKTLSNITFQLSNKNSYTDTIFVSANADCFVQFRLTTEIYVNNVWETANVELTDLVSLLANQIKKLSFGSTFTSLDEVYSLADGNKIRQTLDVITSTSQTITFNVYSNETYPSTFYLNTTSTTIMLQSGKLGELPLYDITGTGDSTKITFTLPSDSDVSNNVEALFILGYSNITPTNATQLEFSYNSQTIQILTPMNNGTNAPATVGSMASKFASNYGKWVFTGIFHIDNGNITLIADVDDLSAKADTGTIADEFSSLSTYAVGDIVIHNNTLYICTTPVSTAGTWDSTKWSATTIDALLATKQPSGSYFRLNTNDWQSITQNLNLLPSGSETIQIGSYPAWFYLRPTITGSETIKLIFQETYNNINHQLRIAFDFSKGGFHFWQVGKGLNDFVKYYFPFKTGTFALEEHFAPQFSTTSTYSVGDLVWYENDLYKCTTAVTTAGAWNSANWTAVTLQDLLLGTYVTLDTDQDVTGKKTIIGNKLLNFKQSSGSDVLGFTALDSSGKEFGNLQVGSINMTPIGANSATSLPLVSLGNETNDEINHHDTQIGFRTASDDTSSQKSFNFLIPKDTKANMNDAYGSSYDTVYLLGGLTDGLNKSFANKAGIADIRNILGVININSLNVEFDDTNINYIYKYQKDLYSVIYPEQSFTYTPNNYLKEDGTTASASNYNITNYLRVYPNSSYNIARLRTNNTLRYGCYYDKNQNFISSFSYQYNSWTDLTLANIPSNAKYVRFTYYGTTKMTYTIPELSALFVKNIGYKSSTSSSSYTSYGVRYDDGLQICWGEVTPTSSGQNVNFMFPFLDTTYSVSGITLSVPTNAIRTLGSNTKDTTYFKAYGMYSQSSTSGLTEDVTYSWQAIGKWK